MARAAAPDNRNVFMAIPLSLLFTIGMVALISV
jgi:hypothetical protein